MFPVTHLYFYSLIFPRSTAGAVGAVFPDTTLLSGLAWSETHLFSTALLERATPEERAGFSEFLQGFLTHAVDSDGLDRYGDEKYEEHDRGYAFIKAGPIVNDVVRACRIPETMGIWKAHNFVEMGIETLVARKNPSLAQWIDEARADKSEIRRISEFLSRYYTLDPDKFERSITDFFQFIISSGNPLDLGHSYRCVLNIRHGVINPDPEEIAQVIEKACKLIENEYMDFLLYCRDRFVKQWKETLNIDEKLVKEFNK